MNRYKNFKLTALALSLLSATSFAATDTSPFSVPLHLRGAVGEGVRQTVTNNKSQEFKQVTETTGSKITATGNVLPNIMLFLDDSNSMNNPFNSPLMTSPDTKWVNGSWWYSSKYGYGKPCPEFLQGKSYCARETRWSYLRRLTRELLVTPYTDATGNTRTYGQRANWGVYWLNTKIDGHAAIATLGIASNGKHNIQIDSPVAVGVGEYQRVYDKLGVVDAMGNTPTGGNYMGVVADLTDHIRYRCQKNYIIALSDGEANKMAGKDDFKGRAPWSTQFSDRVRQFNSETNLAPLNIAGIDIKHGIDPKTGENWDDPAFKDQTIETFTIFVGNDSSYGVEALKSLASKNLLDQDGNKITTSFHANDGDGLKQAFEYIFKNIADSNAKPGETKTEIISGTPVGAPTLSSGNASSAGYRNEETYAIAAPAMISTDVESDEKISEAATILIDKNMRSAQIFFDKRKDDGSIDTSGVRPTASFGSGLFFIRDNENVVRRINFSRSNGNEFFDIQSPVVDTEYKDALLTWLGRGGVDRSKYSTDKYRTDRGTMGDVIESDVVAIGKNIGGKKELVVTAANDGLVYVFKRGASNIGNEYNPYSFAYNFMPVDIVHSSNDDTLSKHYHKIAQENYAMSEENPHIFMLAGGIVVQQFVKTDPVTGEKVFGTGYMLGNAGRGGRGMYGLKLFDNNGDALSSATPLFREIDANTSGYNGLGYTVSYPITGYVGLDISKKRKRGEIGACAADGNPNHCDVGTSRIMTTFLGSGIASNGIDALKDQQTVLYMFKTLDNGAYVNAVHIPEGEGGLMTPALLDIDFDGVYDYAFAGDYGGNMYRFDIRDYSNVTYKKIFSGDGWTGKYPNRPILAAPAIARFADKKYVVIWGTGSDVFDEDLTSKSTQAIYGVHQQFDTDDSKYLDIKSDFNNELDKDDLLTQTFSEVVVADDDNPIHKYRVASDNPIKDPATGDLAYKGWKIELTGAGDGERIVVQPKVVQNTVYFTTRIYGVEDSSAGSLTSSTSIETIPSDIENDADKMNAWFAEHGWKKTNQTTVGSNDASSCDWDNISAVITSDTPSSSTTSSTSSGSDPCLAGSTTVTVEGKKEVKTCNVDWSEITVWEKGKSKPVKNRSSIIQLKVDNGGAIPVPPGKGYSYIKWTIDGGMSYVASSQTTDGFQSFVIHGASETGVNQDANGMGGGSGDVAEEAGALVDNKNNDNPYQKRKVCMGAQKAYKSYLDRTNTNVGGDNNTLDVILSSTGVVCYRRISWREIF